MADVSHIFKAYDIRGKVGDELNEELSRNVARAFADWLPEDGPVAVGYDMRPDSLSLATAAIEGLKLQGREVIDIGQVASDMIYFAVGSLELAGGLMVTASHNPGEYNGIKLCREGAGGIGLDTGLSDIRDKALSQDFAERHQGNVIEKDIMDAWVEHAIKFAGEGLRPLKIGVDAGNGMAGAVVPHLEGKVPFEITPLFFELDGTFPNHQANPLKFETLRDLQEKITDESLDGGVAFDGDGDRAVLVDELGEPLTGSVTTALLAEHFLAAKPGGTVLYNAICSRIVPETVERLGGKSIRTRVGHSIIKQQMKQHDAIFAGEHSAHYYFADNYRADSGLIAAMAVLGLLSRSGKKLSELAAPYRKYENSPEINFEVEDKSAMIERIKQEYSDGEVDELDGLTVNYDDWWFNIRASNTEPLLRLNVEAKDEHSLKDHVAHLKGVLSKKMTNQFEHSEYSVNRKFWKMFGESIRVVSPEGQLILFAKLKAFKLKEDIRLFADESQNQEILRVHARSILDIGTIYDVFDSATDQKIGSVKRKGWKSILQDEWEIWDDNEQVLATATEDSMLLALVRRFLTNLIPQKFTIADPQAQTVANIKQNFNPFTVRLSCSVNEASSVDRRLTIVTTILLAVIEGRQG